MSDQIDTDIPPANPTNEQSTLDLILQEIRSLKDRLSIVENNQKAFLPDQARKIGELSTDYQKIIKRKKNKLKQFKMLSIKNMKR